MNLKLFLSTFLLIFLAELGDKTQLAAMARAATSDGGKWIVFSAAASALVFSTLIAVLVGGVLSRYVPERVIKALAGTLFVAIGLLFLYRAVVPAGARAARIALIGWCLLLALPALTQMLLMLHDTQSVQRETLTFVHRNFGSADAGFHPESALFCRLGPQPIPIHLSETIYCHFAGAERERNSAQMMNTFRGQPIAFIVQSFRLNQFPVELRRFWAENYQPYRASVFVAGRRLEGAKGARSEFGLFVPGAYRWLPFAGPQPVRIDGQLLAAGEVASFEPGDHTAEFVEDVPGGMLVLALQDPPGPAPQEFYKHY